MRQQVDVAGAGVVPHGLLVGQLLQGGDEGLLVGRRRQGVELLERPGGAGLELIRGAPPDDCEGGKRQVEVKTDGLIQWGVFSRKSLSTSKTLQSLQL